ncbi:Cytochrome P450 94A2 [Leucoagaricus sp. SymC.cos]|nr:Cytochrome P450 94A2 [Leucoagaricus sp. SymC.cos]
MSLTRVSVSLGGTVALYVLYKAYDALYRDFTSPIKHLPGLSSANILIGNLKEMMFMDQGEVHGRHAKKLGTTFKFKAMLWDNWLFTADIKAISHILRNDTEIWQKPQHLAYNLLKLLGPGMILVDSDVHKRQASFLNPAFSPSEIKQFTEIFFDKAVKLRDIWTAQLQQADGEQRRIDILSWLSRATLDVIGEAGFGYKFDSLSEEPDKTNELHEAFSIMFKVGTNPSVIRLLRGLIPATRFLSAERDWETDKARTTMDRIGKQLLVERELALDPGLSEKGHNSGNDILSLLVRANASGDSHHRLPEDQVLAQIPTFIVAGHETTSTATAWALFSIAQDQSVQMRLREELLAVTSENPSMDELNALPYLDAVVRETMRIHSPVPATMRLAAEDDVLPLQNPVVDKNGKIHHELKVSKGQIVCISLVLVNRLEEIWGKDADQFKPDRWSSPPEAANSIPGVWGNLLSFFGGPRACIGYRFSLIEMKALLFTLIRAFEFELAVPASDILKRSEIVTRPVLRTDPSGSNQLPVLVRPVA